MYTNPQYLVSVEELSAALDDTNTRVFDTNITLIPVKNGYESISGREAFESAHIPGAGFIDLTDHWAEVSSPLRFTLPDLPNLKDAIGESGIDASNRVILYSSGHLMWATRAWWMLYHAGHRNMAILNGNFTAWKAAELPTASGPSAYTPTEFNAESSENKFADTQTVEAGMHGEVCTINALSQSLYEGTGDFYYSRRGHIPGSLPLFYDALLENEYFLPETELKTALENHGALSADRVITYCGGGIAATLDAFACVLCGQESVQVYDGSMSEWVQEPSRPLTEGSAP